MYVYFSKCAVQIKHIPATTTVAVFFIHMQINKSLIIKVLLFFTTSAYSCFLVLL